MSEYRFCHNRRKDKIWWVDNPDNVGEWLFSFDREKVYNLFLDYPHNLTKKQKEGREYDWKDEGEYTIANNILEVKKSSGKVKRYKRV